MRTKLIEGFGWYGTVAILGTYALISFGAMSPESFAYQALNITGAIGVMIVAYRKAVYQSAVINLIWAIIGIVAIVKMFW
ncbi:MAG: hypothetical protein HZA25_01005 [Candidatus Niyogibacteria bacterium]|nr:hypothetical protein [Candidatus Niyogibacteria bacterium]